MRAAGRGRRAAGFVGQPLNVKPSGAYDNRRAQSGVATRSTTERPAPSAYSLYRLMKLR
jgi:hypothetical protein